MRLLGYFEPKGLGLGCVCKVQFSPLNMVPFRLRAQSIEGSVGGLRDRKN